MNENSTGKVKPKIY